jgi:hypothetical protein
MSAATEPLMVKALPIPLVYMRADRLLINLLNPTEINILVLVGNFLC